MGQYWRAVNLDKHEFLDPYKLGHGSKLWEHLANHPGVGAALIVLCAAQPYPRGVGDLEMDENWHGPERSDFTREGPRIDGYETIARRTIGRWAGDRIALVGDYAQPDDLPPSDRAEEIYHLCCGPDEDEDVDPQKLYTDVTDDVLVVLRHELHERRQSDLTVNPTTTTDSNRKERKKMNQFSGPMFESSRNSVFNREGAHYNIYEVPTKEAMDLLRTIFPDATGNSLNLCLFSTSGVHGMYTTIEEARAEMGLSLSDEDGEPTTPTVTFLVVHPRIVCLRYGNVQPKTDEDWEFLIRLRATSWEASQKIGK